MRVRQAELEHQIEIDKLQQQSKLDALRAMIDGQEEERKRIAYDLHDQLGGLLTTAKLELSKSITTEDPENNIQSVVDKIDQACNDVRRIAHNMMPHALMKMGLDSAVGDLVESLNQSGTVDLTYQNLADVELDAEQKISVYRIIHELISNSIKHADPESILIQLSRHNGTFSLVVEDDGQGFDPKTVNEGLGLHSLKSRVEYLNGDYTLDSRPGEGTSITVDFPVRA